jgi:ADP-heptose:LPS heptosyltransferase
MKTLVYHFGALGDFLTILPLIAVWKDIKETTVTLLGKPLFGFLAKAAGYIDEIVDADSCSNLFLFSKKPDPGRIRNFFAPFDAVILFASPDSPLIDNARRFSFAKIIGQPPFPEARIPVVDYHLSLIEDIHFPLKKRIPTLSLPCEPHNHSFHIIRKNRQPVIALHPGSGSNIKNWPLVNFLSLANRLRNDHYSVLWICGPAETYIDTPPEDMVIRDMPLPELAGILPYCAAFIGNDSGITHLAAAAGCPVIALFGPSDPVVWGPRGSKDVKILYHSLACSPCHHRTNKAKTCSRECINSIQHHEVITALYGLTHTIS